jgi:hypothetical protein
MGRIRVSASADRKAQPGLIFEVRKTSIADLAQPSSDSTWRIRASNVRPTPATSEASS